MAWRALRVKTCVCVCIYIIQNSFRIDLLSIEKIGLQYVFTDIPIFKANYLIHYLYNCILNNTHSLLRKDAKLYN